MRERRHKVNVKNPHAFQDKKVRCCMHVAQPRQKSGAYTASCLQAYSSLRLKLMAWCCLQNPVVVKGCNCLRSRCLKGYCECFAAARSCMRLCCCVSCANTFGTRTEAAANDAESTPVDTAAHAAPEATLPPVIFTELSRNRSRPARRAVSRQLEADDDNSAAPASARSGSAPPPSLKRTDSASREHLIGKRQGLDNLVAAAAAVEADKRSGAAVSAAGAASRQLQRPAWDRMLEQHAELQAGYEAPADRAAAPQPSGALQTLRLRRTSAQETGAIQPQVCYMLSAGVDLKASTHYTVQAGEIVDPAAHALLPGPSGRVASTDLPGHPVPSIAPDAANQWAGNQQPAGTEQQQDRSLLMHGSDGSHIRLRTLSAAEVEERSAAAQGLQSQVFIMLPRVQVPVKRRTRLKSFCSEHVCNQQKISSLLVSECRHQQVPSRWHTSLVR